MGTKSFLLCLLWTHLTLAQYEGPLNFVTVKMANFSTWANASNMDPSPVVPEEVYFEGKNAVADLKCYITNHGVRGHSKNVTIQDITFDLLTLKFKVDFDLLESITFFGDYSITGTMNSVKPISSRGTWNLTVPTVNLTTFEATLFLNIIGDRVMVRYYNLREINLSDEDGFEMYFESLLEQPGVIGYEEYVENALFEGFSSQILSSTQDPLRMLYQTFWNETFQLSNVTLEEFTGATLPPPTTTDAYTTTTTDAYTTTTTAIPNECPATGTDLIPHPTSCSKYFLCVEGTAYEQECADGLHFNPVIKECDFPENVDCTPFPECPPEGVVFLPYPGNCSLYILCAEGTPLIRHCAEGTCLDPEELKCLINGTAAFDIPKQVFLNQKLDSYRKVITECHMSKGTRLLSSLATAQEFSVCEAGLYKATFLCPTAHVFDSLLQDCKNENI